MLALWGYWPLSATATDHSASKPLWDIGLAGGAGWIPDYPAADENHAVGIVLPLVIYRGKVFRAGDDGIARGRLLRSAVHEFDISISGSFPVDSDNNEARRGMPNLDFLFEVGPRLKLTLLRFGPQAKIGFELPVRAVFSIDLDAVGYRGVVTHPKLAYTHSNLFDTGWQLRVSAGPIFATEALMAYFYDVAPRFATSTRPAFDADAGYLGSEFTLFVRKQLSRRFTLFGAVQIGYYQGATNDQSPLFRSDVNMGMGVGLSWSIWQSTRQVVE